jgi:predicted PurR-regulated permease PerM
MLGIEFPFFATFLCVLVSVLPVVPAWLVCVPWAVLHCAKGDWLIGMALFLSQYLLLTFLDNEVCGQSQRGHQAMENPD